MKYAFFGSPRFAKIVLENLVKHGEVPVALICNPDRPVGRDKTITSPETKQFIKEAGLEGRVRIFQPEKTREIIEDLKGLGVEIFIVAAYAKIIPEEVLQIPLWGAMGVHPSLLPLYRGPSPLQMALLDGVEKTGVSIYKMDKEVDHGPVLGVKELDIKNKSIFYSELEEMLAILGAKAVLEFVPQYLEGKLSPKEQGHALATFTSKFETQDGFVDYKILEQAKNGDSKEAALKIERMIRALTPEPGVWTSVPQKEGGEKRLKLLKAIINNDKLVLQSGQWEGKKPQNF